MTNSGEKTLRKILGKLQIIVHTRAPSCKHTLTHTRTHTHKTRLRPIYLFIVLCALWLLLLGAFFCCLSACLRGGDQMFPFAQFYSHVRQCTRTQIYTHALSNVCVHLSAVLPNSQRQCHRVCTAHRISIASRSRRNRGIKVCQRTHRSQ